MTHPQPGIFALGTRAHHHLQFDLSDGLAAGVEAGTPDAVDAFWGVVAGLREATTSVAGVNLVVGFKPSLWASLRPDGGSDGVVDFSTVGTGPVAMPADQHDVWLWLHGASSDGVLSFARQCQALLEPVAALAAEQACFVNGASQDLTGFEDGTENPPLDEAIAVASVAGGVPGAGSSVALVQRWVHDLDRFAQLDVAQQEQVIGRTLDGSVELDDEVQSPRSHVSRVVIEDDDGEELEVFRRSTSFGDLDEAGLMFVGFSAEQSRLQQMLEAMVGLDDGVTDELTEFSTSTGAAWYVVPAVGALRPC